MDKLKILLKGWTKGFLKHKDIIKKEILDIEENKEGFDLTINTKDGKRKHYIILPLAENINRIIEKLDDDDFFGVVMLNTKDNLKVILSNWETISRFKKLCLFFVNPFSETEKKWMIFPYTHSKISDKESLESGLKSLFDSVDCLSKKDIASIA